MVLILAMKRVFDLGNTTLLLTVATRENIWCNWRSWCLPYIQVPASHRAALGQARMLQFSETAFGGQAHVTGPMSAASS